MAFVFYSISDAEMERRCSRAAECLRRNPDAAVILMPGIFQASGWTPSRVIQEVTWNWGDWGEMSSEVFITRRSDGRFVLKASRC